MTAAALGTKDPVVVALVWTYNRFAVVSACISALQAQSRPPDRIIVADSASPDGTASLVATAHPEVQVVLLDENEGMGAAIAAGLGVAGEQPYDYLWFVEDDSSPAADALAQQLAFLEANGAYSVVSQRGALLRRGRWHWMEHGVNGPCDFCILDGSLMRRAAIEAAGVPRADFFIMQVDIDYPLRVKRAGHAAYQLGTVEHGALQLGAAGNSRWRAYYQTRNHLRMAIDHCSGWLVWGFLRRTVAQCLTEIRGGPVGRRSVRRRFKGIVDALRGRMGRTVEPD